MRKNASFCVVNTNVLNLPYSEEESRRCHLTKQLEAALNPGQLSDHLASESNALKYSYFTNVCR